VKDLNNKTMEFKTYFSPGDLCTINKDLPNKPIMMVVRKKTMTIKGEDEKFLQGIICRWFTEDGHMEE
jgi:hypothetical protein